MIKSDLNKKPEALEILKLFRKYDYEDELFMSSDSGKPTLLEQAVHEEARISLIRYLVEYTRSEYIGDVNGFIIDLVNNYNDANLLKYAMSKRLIPFKAGLIPNVIAADRPLVNVREEVAENSEIMDLLLGDLNPNCTIVIENNDGQRHVTPLMVACFQKNHPLIKYLIAKGADINYEIHTFTAMKAAVHMKDNDLINLLVKLGATTENNQNQEQNNNTHLKEVPVYSHSTPPSTVNNGSDEDLEETYGDLTGLTLATPQDQ